MDIYQLTSSAFKNENDKAAKSRHFYSNVVSGLYAGIDIDNDWVNYLFAAQGDVYLNNDPFMSGLLKLQTPESFMPQQVYLMNIANIRGGPLLLLPDYLFKRITLKVTRSPVWREQVQLYDHRGSSGAHITAEADIGLVTFDGQSLTHDLYGVHDAGRSTASARLAPRTWGPARVPLRLGR